MDYRSRAKSTWISAGSKARGTSHLPLPKVRPRSSEGAEVTPQRTTQQVGGHGHGSTAGSERARQLAEKRRTERLTDSEYAYLETTSVEARYPAPFHPYPIPMWAEELGVQLEG